MVGCFDSRRRVRFNTSASVSLVTHGDALKPQLSFSLFGYPLLFMSALPSGCCRAPQCHQPRVSPLDMSQTLALLLALMLR